MFEKIAEESELFDRLNQSIQDGSLKTDERYSHFNRMFTEGTDGCGVNPSGVQSVESFDVSKLNEETAVPEVDKSQIDFPFTQD